MKSVIKVSLNSSDIDAAIIELKARKKWLEERCLEFRHRVAERVKEYADNIYTNTYYNDWVNGGKDFGPAVPVIVEETKDASIVVAGYPAVFIEFGAGITHNGGQIYRTEHYYGYVLNILIGTYPGEHGVPSWGQYEQWYVEGRGLTRGTGAQKVLYNAVRLVAATELEKIAREVFEEDD